MQPGGFGGGHGQPPGGYPPPGGQPPQGGHPQAPQQQGGYPQAPQQQGGYPQAPQQQGGYPQAPGGQPGMPGGQPGMPGGQPGMPGGQPGMPGGMGQSAAVQNRYASAQSALKTGSTTLKFAMYGMGGFGALCAVGGIVYMIMGSFTGGITMIIMGVVLVGTAFTMPKFMGMMNQATTMVDGLAAKDQLAQTGMPATGSIVQLQQTGRMVNGNPEALATVQVTHPQTGQSYQVQTTAVIPQMAIPQVQPGAQVQVRINPQNPQEIALVV